MVRPWPHRPHRCLWPWCWMYTIYVHLEYWITLRHAVQTRTLLTVHRPWAERKERLQRPRHAFETAAEREARFVERPEFCSHCYCGLDTAWHEARQHHRHRERRFPETPKPRQLEKQQDWLQDFKFNYQVNWSPKHTLLSMHIATHALAHARPTMPCIHLVLGMNSSSSWHGLPDCQPSTCMYYQIRPSKAVSPCEYPNWMAECRSHEYHVIFSLHCSRRESRFTGWSMCAIWQWSDQRSVTGLAYDFSIFGR